MPSLSGKTTLRNQGFLRVKEAAEMLGVSPNTLRAWGAAGRIVEYRNPANSYRLYERADLEQFLKDVERSAQHNEE